MSRTKKDRPYWVKINSEGTRTDHDHLRFGKTIYRPVYVLDANGEKVSEEYTPAPTIYNPNPKPHTRFKFLSVERFTYADHCTAGEPLKAGGHFNNTNPCTPDLPPMAHREKVHRSDTQDFYGAQRTNTRTKLMGFAKEYNSEGDFDDTDTPVGQNHNTLSWWY